MSSATGRRPPNRGCGAADSRRTRRPKANCFRRSPRLLLGAVGVAGSVSAAWSSCARQSGSGATAVMTARLDAPRCGRRGVTRCFVAVDSDRQWIHTPRAVSISVRNLWPKFPRARRHRRAAARSSRRARDRSRAQWIGSITAFMLIAAAAVSFLHVARPGDQKRRTADRRGRAVFFFYWHVPGFDGLRVPARFAMLVMLFLSIAAGSEPRQSNGGFAAAAPSLSSLVRLPSSRRSPRRSSSTAPSPKAAMRRRRRAFIPATRCRAAYRFLKSLTGARNSRRRVPARRMGVRIALRVLLNRALASSVERLQRPISAQLQHERNASAPSARLS